MGRCLHIPLVQLQPVSAVMWVMIVAKQEVLLLIPIVQ